MTEKNMTKRKKRGAGARRMRDARAKMKKHKVRSDYL